MATGLEDGIISSPPPYLDVLGWAGELASFSAYCKKAHTAKRRTKAIFRTTPQTAERRSSKIERKEVTTVVPNGFVTRSRFPKQPRRHGHSPFEASVLPSDWNAFLDWRRTDTLVLLILRRAIPLLVHASLTMQETAFLYRATTLPCLQLSTIPVAAAVGSVRTGRGQMWDILGERVFRADRGDADVGGFAGFGESIVAGVEVFALL